MRIWLHPPRSLRGRTLLSGSRELSRQRIVRSFFIPQNAQHPPAFAIVKQLNAVDPPLERLFCWGTARFVAALMAKLSAYTACFDNRRSSFCQPFVVVSGYVANLHQWKFFFTQCGVQIDDVFMLTTMVPAYALGARACVALIEFWQREFDFKYPPEWVFEDGDFGRGKFMDLMRVKRMPAPIFKDKNDFPGLQAADHIAWEQGNDLKQERAGKPVERNQPFSQFLAIPHLHTQATLGRG
jgi:hypothetical protein